ncbi:peptidoglycan-binding protein [Calothrix sp. HK-06]|nr:peptidoglycan-binding protein [Calothrix sp. HK-06]
MTAIQCPTFKPTLRLGNNGQDVKEMQKRLNQRLAAIYSPALEIDVDGDFGAGTETAVRYLQCLGFINNTGVTDAATWNFICDGAASLPVLKLNSSGSVVKSLQEALSAAGFYNGAIDGVLGAKTVQAVKDFQAYAGLTADGVVGAKSWDALIKLDSHVERCFATYYGGC